MVLKHDPLKIASFILFLDFIAAASLHHPLL